MIQTIFEGYIIGLCTSIPVGPIAILCIQRALQGGRWHGFCSGLGAASSDAFYALLAMLGLSMVMSFIQENQLAIQVGGCIVMVAFGVFLFLQNPNKDLKRPKESKKIKAIDVQKKKFLGWMPKFKKPNSPYWQEYATAFSLTLTNPMMVFLFLGLFAQFNFLAGEASFWHILIALLSIFAGSASWWLFVTSVAGIFRRKFDLRRLKILNQISGGLIAVLALLGLVLSLMGYSLTL